MWNGGKPARRQSDIDIDLVARLSRLNIPEGDRAAMEADMRAIVEFAGELSELDTTGVPVMAHAVALDSVLRDDVAVKSENARAMIAAVRARTIRRYAGCAAHFRVGRQ